MEEIDKKEKEYFYILFCDYSCSADPLVSYVGVNDKEIILRYYRYDEENKYLQFETFEMAKAVASNLLKELKDDNLEYTICRKKIITTTFMEEYRCVNNELVKNEKDNI